MNSLGPNNLENTIIIAEGKVDLTNEWYVLAISDMIEIRRRIAPAIARNLGFTFVVFVRTISGIKFCRRVLRFNGFVQRLTKEPQHRYSRSDN